jgi:hypothetical protein
MVKAAELKKRQKEIENIKFKTFEKILKLIEKKIILASSVNYYSIWFEIPEFILGYPKYELPECVEYLEKKLEKDGFKTRLYQTNFLYVEWND